VMRATSEGRTILKEMTNLKIIDKVWNTLYTHTNMTQRMIDYITELSSQNENNIETAIKIINYYYQDWLRDLLLSWWSSINRWYEDIVNIFLRTGNRNYWNNVKWLKDLWITRVIHWHNSQGGKITTIDWIEFMDIDTGYWKKWWFFGGGEYSGKKAAFRIKWTEEITEAETPETEEDTI
jgi:hypothetical protein